MSLHARSKRSESSIGCGALKSIYTLADFENDWFYWPPKKRKNPVSFDRQGKGNKVFPERVLAFAVGLDYDPAQ